MDEKNPTTDVIGALAEDVDGEVLGEGPGIASDGQSGAGSEVLEQASAEFLGRWNRLVSTTNWEKGRIISAWRKAMIDSGAPAQAYSDEAWARRVGNVSGQHVGRLRRVYDRFGGGFDSYPGLFWSHFQAALDWHDAEMWLEGAVQNSWSVAQMRNQRWEATGAADGEAPPDEEILLADWLSAHGVRTAYVGDTDNSPQYRKGFADEIVVSHVPSRLEEVPETVPLPADGRKLRYPESYAQRVARDAAGWDGEADRRAPRTMMAAHRWLEDRTGDDEPFFLWVDTFDPHEPWDPPRHYIDPYDAAYQGDELYEPAYEEAGYASPAEIAHMRCLYAAKLTMVDRWVGHLLEGLRLMGREDDTAIIFTSDHGFYHGEHGYIGKVKLNRENRIVGRWPLFETISHTPLMLRVPGLGPRSVERLLRWRRQDKIREVADLGRAGAMTARAAPFLLLDGVRPPHQLPLWEPSLWDREPGGNP